MEGAAVSNDVLPFLIDKRAKERSA